MSRGRASCVLWLCVAVACAQPEPESGLAGADPGLAPWLADAVEAAEAGASGADAAAARAEGPDAEAAVPCLRLAGLCDDGNPCTVDACGGLAVDGLGCQHVAVTGACDDGDACTDGDGCVGGKCASGLVKPCPDGAACTVAACDPVAGCLVVAADGLPCSDGNACTSGDGCKDLACVPGAPLDCADGNPCTVDGCDAVVGCTALPTDGATCGAGLVCHGSVCGLPCGACPPCQACDPSLGACKADPQLDGKVCAGAKVCSQGSCTGKVFLAPPGDLVVAFGSCCGGCYGSMTWSLVDGAGSYESRVRHGNAVVWGPTTSSGGQAIFDFLQIGVPYVFEVRACKVAGCSAWKGVAAIADGPGC